MQAPKRFVRSPVRPTWLLWVLVLACLMSSDGQRTLGRSLETIISGIQNTLNGFAHANQGQNNQQVKTALFSQPTQTEGGTPPLLERFVLLCAVVALTLLLLFLMGFPARDLVFFGFARAPPLFGLHALTPTNFF